MEEYIEAANELANDLFNKYCNSSFVFHNLLHTKKVVSHVADITLHAALSQHEIALVTIAAWFHDTGYLFAAPKVHEEKSVEIMRDFFSGKAILQQDLDSISECIMATKIPTHPLNLLQQVLCDADTFHLGTPEFIESNEKVFLEFNRRDTIIGRKDFIHGSIDMLRSHNFYTDYCRQLLDEGKAENIIWLSTKEQW